MATSQSHAVQSASPKSRPSKRLKMSSSPRYNSRPKLSWLSAKARIACLSRRRRHLVQSVSEWLRHSKYEHVYKQIIASGPAAERAFNKMIKRQCKRQITKYLRNGAVDFPKFTHSKSVMYFCCTDVVAQHCTRHCTDVVAQLSKSLYVQHCTRHCLAPCHRS